MTNPVNAGRIPEFEQFDRLKKARETAGFSQAELAEVTGLGLRSISGYEKGVRMPRRPALIAWAMATGVPLVWLETGKAPSPDGDGAFEVRHQGLEPRTR